MPRNPRLPLFAISFLALFFELGLIRFINSTVQVVAYFNSFLILSAFLGLGLGSYLASAARPRGLLRFLPLALPLLVALAVWLDQFGSTASNDLAYFVKIEPGRSVDAVAVMFAVFCANCAFFVPIGHQLGASIAAFDDRLEAYGWDLGGSFAGVVAFTLVSFAQSPPWTWFALASLVVIWLLKDAPRGKLVLYGAGLVAGLALSTLPEAGLWSPYYKIGYHPYLFHGEPIGYSIQVDKLRIQDALKFGPVLESSPMQGWVPYYRLPYRFRKPERVLVLGGGSGNDAAVALREGASHVDVVEIDPVLVRAGSWLHPERPYADPRVHAINDDARAFLRRSHDTYDLIVMNALDSHKQLAGMSTLRLESFIYTREAFEDVRRHMTPESIFVVHLASAREWMGQRLYTSLAQAFGAAPRLFTTKDSPFESIAFCFGPKAVLDAVGGDVVPASPAETARVQRATRPATDDWPHLYLETNRLPGVYLKVLGLIVLFAGAILFRSVRRLGHANHLHLCLLGAGFMLLETRSITQVALLFGSTWIVNAVVIGAILAVIFCGNAVLARGIRVPKALCYAGLFASLATAYAIDLGFILDFGPLARLALTTLWIGTPVFFASLIFSHSFRDVTDAAGAFGANLLGVVLGGALEYASMVYGLNSLYLIAIAIYALALAAERLGAAAPRGLAAEAAP